MVREAEKSVGRPIGIYAELKGECSDGHSSSYIPLLAIHITSGTHPHTLVSSRVSVHTAMSYTTGFTHLCKDPHEVKGECSHGYPYSYPIST